MISSFIAPVELLPAWFSYDKKYIFFISNNILELKPFRFLDSDAQVVIRNRVLGDLNIDCVPVCVDNELDEFIGWARIDGVTSIIRAPFEGSGAEIYDKFEDFWEVIDYIIVRFKEFYEGS